MEFARSAPSNFKRIIITVSCAPLGVELEGFRALIVSNFNQVNECHFIESSMW